MEDGKLSVAIFDHRREFVEEELAGGVYADEAEVVDAALELLQARKKRAVLRTLIAEGDEDIAAGRVHVFDNAGEMARYVVERAKTRN